MEKIAKTSDQNECAICYEEITRPKTLTCGHKFCFKCVSTVVNCPLCRKPLNVSK